MDNDEKNKTSVSETKSSANQTKHSTTPTGSSVANIESTSRAGSDHPYDTHPEIKDETKGTRHLYNYLYNEAKNFLSGAEKPSTSTDAVRKCTTENSEARDKMRMYVSKLLQTRIDEEYVFVADNFMSREAPSISDFCKEQLLESITKLEETVASARNHAHSSSSSDIFLDAFDGSLKVWRKSEEMKRTPQDSQEENETLRRVSPNDSISIICRICYNEAWGTPDLGPLVSPCNCRGSVQMVHMACLQRWLTESGTESCDLCGYRFRVRWIQRTGLLNSFFAWIWTEEDALQLLTDLALLFAMTPLVIFTAHRCLEASHILFVDRRTSHLLLVSFLLLFGYFAQVSYYFWLISAFFYHAQNWMRWWRRNFSIEILPQDTT